jgi:hypothetical protein
MDRFIHDENLRHYRRLLEQTIDPAERERILKLLAEEETRSVAAGPSPDPTLDRRHG